MDANTVWARLGSVGVIIALLVLILVAIMCVTGTMTFWPEGAILGGLALAVMLR